MPDCELCGKDGVLVGTIIEGTRLNVCGKCKVHGKVLESFEKPQVSNKVFVRKAEPTEDVVDNYPMLIKSKREKLGLSQSELASRLNEREGLISKIESGSLKPDLNLSRKIGKFLGINLISEVSSFGPATKINSSALTIGDLLKK